MAPSTRQDVEPRRAFGEATWLAGSARTALAAGDPTRALELTARLVATCDLLTVRGLAPAALSGEARAASALLERGASRPAGDALARAEEALRRARARGAAPLGSRAA